MTKGGKGEKKGEKPEDKIKARAELVDSAFEQFRAFTFDLASEMELSSLEVFLIMSRILVFFGEPAVEAEHEDFFGPKIEDDGT
jgi:hypothetical protein